VSAIRMPSLASLRVLVDEGRRIFHTSVEEVERVCLALSTELDRAQAWVTDGVGLRGYPSVEAEEWLDRAATLAVDSLPHVRRLLAKGVAPATATVPLFPEAAPVDGAIVQKPLVHAHSTTMATAAPQARDPVVADRRAVQASL